MSHKDMDRDVHLALTKLILDPDDIGHFCAGRHLRWRKNNGRLSVIVHESGVEVWVAGNDDDEDDEGTSVMYSGLWAAALAGTVRDGWERCQKRLAERDNHTIRAALGLTK